jgi:hypothetical protein
MDELYKPYFPALSDVQKKKTSDPDARYNCIAWAFGDTHNLWWPNKNRSYWPVNAAGKPALTAFEEWFVVDGWVETQNCTFEPGFIKVALFTKNGTPTHAARLMRNGLWTSKLGRDIDLSHKLRELEGPMYGTIYKLYRKPISSISTIAP